MGTLYCPCGYAHRLNGVYPRGCIDCPLWCGPECEEERDA